MANFNDRNAEQVERLSIFELFTHFFALEISQIREVIPLPAYTPLPNSNRTYIGVFNLRGEIYPLADISPLLGFPNKEIYADDMVVLIDSDEMVVGFIVDKIYGMIHINPTEIKLPRGLVPHSMEKYIAGVVEHQRKQYFILDVNTLFKSHELLAFI